MVGDHSNEDYDTHEQNFDVEEMIWHEQYRGPSKPYSLLNIAYMYMYMYVYIYFSGNSYNHDIALMKLRRQSDGRSRRDDDNNDAIEFSEYVQPACLPEHDTNYTRGHQCLISGWGSVTYSLFDSLGKPKHSR